MSINKRRWIRSNGRVVERFEAEWMDAEGNRRRKSFRKEQDAKDHLKALIKAGGGPGRSAKATFAEVAAEWISECERKQHEGDLERGTVEPYKRHVRLHLNPKIGSLRFEDLDSAVLEKAISDLRRAGMSRALARAVLATLRLICKFAVKKYGLRANPAPEVEGLKSGGRNDAPLEIPSKAQIRKLISVITSPSDRPALGEVFIRTLVGSGLRASEARALRLQNLNLDVDPAEIVVRERVDAWNKLAGPKSHAGYRTIPIGPDLADLLRQWLVVRPPIGDLVFSTVSGGFQNLSNLHHRVWQPAMRRAGLAKVTLVPKTDRGSGTTCPSEKIEPLFTMHALRHVYASGLIEGQNEPKRVQYLMGHSSLQMTFDLYGHLWRDLEKDARMVADFEHRLFKAPLGRTTSVSEMTKNEIPLVRRAG